MLNLKKSQKFVLLLLCVSGMVTHASPVYSESIVWNHSISRPLWDMWTSGTGATNNSVWSMSGVQVQISYRVSAKNLTKGTMISCNGKGSAHTGDNIQFQFLPHTHTDISWFAAGQSYDSPYGSWIDGAAKPYPDMCPHYEDRDYVGSYSTNEGYGQGKFYATLSVNPPGKSLVNISGFKCGNTDAFGGKTCSAAVAGKIFPSFSFAPTYGYFYGRGTINRGFLGSFDPRFDQCRTSNKPMETAYAYASAYWIGEGPYKVDVPQQKIACPITIISPQVENSTSSMARAPSLSASGGSCVLGSPFSMQFSGTDPQNETIRYEIDWNDDGSTDELVPASGYVSSGSSQTASRTYSNTGSRSKTVNVRFRDVGGNASPWATLNFQCAAPTSNNNEETVGLNGNSDGTGFGGQSGLVNPTPDLRIELSPSFLRRGKPTEVNWSASRVTSCVVTAPNGDSWTGITGTEISKPIQNATRYTLTCQSNQGVKVKNAVVNILPTWTER